MPNEGLVEFLRQQCQEKRLSLRRLSISSGLSPATVHGIIKREYQPTLYSLNRLADYLGVRREYLWYLAGLLEDMDYDAETTFGDDPRLRFYFVQVGKLTKGRRNLIIRIIQAVIAHIKADRDSQEALPPA